MTNDICQLKKREERKELTYKYLEHLIILTVNSCGICTRALIFT